MLQVAGATYATISSMNLDDYMTTREAADTLGVGLQRIYNLIEEKRLEATQVAGRWLVTKDSVANFERLKPWEKTKQDQNSV